MQAWFQFFGVMAAAAATLMGLLFVVVSLNAPATLGGGDASSKHLAEQAFQNYLAVLLISLLALFPNMSVSTFGFVTICVTATWVGWMLLRLYRVVTGPSEHGAGFQGLRRHFSSVLGFGILIVTALRMALHDGDEHNLFASAILILLFSATAVSWELLKRLARAKSGQ
ncbi:MAG: hypothetical protein ACRYG5_14055 [Janthinobacterium lividum]